MTFNTFIQVLRNIVVYWPYQEVGRVNCFATFKDRAEVLHSTFGRTYKDYLEGYFWSRPWVLAGAPRNAMERSFGAILVEHKRGRVMDASLGMVEQIVFVNSLQLVEQGEALQTEDSLAILNQQILLSFLREIDLVMQYTVTPTAGSPYSAWLSPTHAALLEADPGVSSVDEQGHPLAAYITNWGSQEVLQNYFGIEEQRSSMIELRVKTCDAPVSNFDYGQADTPPALSYIVVCD